MYSGRSRPSDKGGGARSQKTFFRSFGPHFGLKLKRGLGARVLRAPLLDPPLVYICYFSFNSAVESRRVGFSHGPSSSQISQDHGSNQTVCQISFWKFPTVTCNKYLTRLREVKSNFSFFSSFYPYIDINCRVFGGYIFLYATQRFWGHQVQVSVLWQQE